MTGLILAVPAAVKTIGGILIALLILLLMITIHELGHFTAGKILKFKINEFAVGFGPKLLAKKTKSGTVVSLRAVPLGGFCAFEGEDEENPSPDAFNNQKPWKRIIVQSMGAIFNIVSAVVFSFILLLAVGNPLDVEGIKIYELYDTATAGVTAESPNPNLIDGKIKVGDIIKEITYTDKETGEKFTVTVKAGSDFSEALKRVSDEFAENGSHQYSMLMGREGSDVLVTGLTKWHYTKGGDAAAGLGAGLTSFFKDDFTFGEALAKCVPYTFRLAGMVLSALGQIFTTVTGIRNVGGTFTTIGVMAQATSANLANILVLLPLIAVNLGVFNLLPIPALDGSRIIFVIIEWIRGKPVNRKVEGWIHAIGLIVLFTFVIVMDILQIFVFKNL